VGTPAVLHANAGDGKWVYEPMVRAWKAALQNSTVTLAVTLPYFRGIAQHKMGNDLLALVSHPPPRFPTREGVLYGGKAVCAW
jgi:hypothetical protein